MSPSPGPSRKVFTILGKFSKVQDPLTPAVGHFEAIFLQVWTTPVPGSWSVLFTYPTGTCKRMKGEADEDAGPASRARASKDRDGDLTHSPRCETPSLGEGALLR